MGTTSIGDEFSPIDHTSLSRCLSTDGGGHRVKGARVRVATAFKPVRHGI